MSARVALATCSRFPDGDPESATLGLPCVVWDDPSVDWSAFDLVVIRSTWDYTTKVDEFLEWVDRVPRLRNEADVVHWNHDKRYLGALASTGIPIVPTRFVTSEDGVELPVGQRYVVKPTISVGAHDTFACDADEAVVRVAELNRDGRVAMVQPYVDGIDERGETALVYLGGHFSHAARKNAVLGAPRQPDGAYVEGHTGARTPTTAELELGEAALDTIPFDRWDLVYARVDLIPGPSGEPLLLELELIEPQLFLAEAPDPLAAANRLLQVIEEATI